MKYIDRKLLIHLVDIVYKETNEDSPTPEQTRKFIIDAIEKRRLEKYTSPKNKKGDL